MSVKRVNWDDDEEEESRKKVKKDQFLDDESSDEGAGRESEDDKEDKGSDDSDEEVEEVEEIESSSDVEEKEVKIEAFNMKKEYRQGGFNDAGSYIKNDHDYSSDSNSDDEENAEDVNLKSADMESVKKAYLAEKTLRESHDKKDDAQNEVHDAIRRLCGYLQDDDDTAGARMQYLYAAVKKNRRRGKSKSKSKKTKGKKEEEGDDGVNDEIEGLSQCVAVLEGTHSDVLWMRRSTLEKML